MCQVHAWVQRWSSRLSCPERFTKWLGKRQPYQNREYFYFINPCTLQILEAGSIRRTNIAWETVTVGAWHFPSLGSPALCVRVVKSGFELQDSLCHTQKCFMSTVRLDKQVSRFNKCLKWNVNKPFTLLFAGTAFCCSCVSTCLGDRFQGGFQPLRDWVSRPLLHFGWGLAKEKGSSARMTEERVRKAPMSPRDLLKDACLPSPQCAERWKCLGWPQWPWRAALAVRRCCVPCS